MKFRPYVLVPLAIAATLISSAAISRADVILDWNALMIGAIHIDNSGPTLSSRNLAILHTAIYDAVNSVLRTHQPYKFQLTVPTGTSAEAAAVGAAYEVMKTLYQPLQAQADDLYQNWLAAAPPGASLTNGLALGEQIAQLVLQDRTADGSSTDVPYIPSAAPGQWRRTPPFFRPPLTPQWRYVTPFCLPGLESFMPPPPPALDSPEYATALNEVKAIGSANSTVRTAEQSLIARYWSDFSYTSMPPGHWHLIAETIARDRNNTLADNARLFALISLAQADGAILCWEVKFRYNFWRPVTAIQRADEDNNPLTEADKNWGQFLPSPPFPSYTSGHSTFSKASAQVLTHFYGTDAITFTTSSDTVQGVFRSFNSLAVCADEIGMSRIYGGFHFMFDNVQGKATGKKIGDYVSANFLLPNDRLPLVRLEGFQDGTPLVRVHGHIGQTCVLEVSTDLRTWQSIATNQVVVGGSLIRDARPPTQAQQFYRAKEN
ncbi:MAG: vanadium-dependent haloperoxidase [Verrucomicrobia bacterium]|nr:vanadium-dependent haloperoxidase [Verrucomicrobiota bacterium]